MLDQSRSTEKYDHTLIWIEDGRLHSSTTEPKEFSNGSPFKPTKQALRQAHTKLLNKIAREYAPDQMYGTIRLQRLTTPKKKGIQSLY